MSERIIGYIDGFNLYFGLKSKGWKKFYWLNIQSLLKNFLKPDQELVYTKYFTARISYPPDKVKRQNTYVEALQTLPETDLFFGKYQMNSQECRRCGYIQPVPSEKMTDVNIAVEMMRDAFQDCFDTAFLISADSDLSAPVKSVLDVFPDKRVICIFPPNRSSFELSKIASGYFTIGKGKLSTSLFPDTIKKADGFILSKPNNWI